MALMGSLQLSVVLSSRETKIFHGGVVIWRNFLVLNLFLETCRMVQSHMSRSVCPFFCKPVWPLKTGFASYSTSFGHISTFSQFCISKHGHEMDFYWAVCDELGADR